MFERFVRDHILDHVAPILVDQQHGFVSGRSCISNLLEFMDAVNEIIESGDCVDVFYLDFQKAFDTVSHYRLLIKLQNYGLSEKVLNVISGFLSGRSFNVKVGDCLSETHGVTSGVPQGSVLGPLLFLRYINDLPREIRNSIFMFAYDVKMSARSSTPEINQADIDRLNVWQNLWLLKFNTTDAKCKVMRISKSNPKHTYSLGEVELPAVDSEKDLGVHVNYNLSWEIHIEKFISKAKSCISWVSRSIISRDSHVLKSIYKSLVRPHLEYCVQLWTPLPAHGNWNTILQIEDVQRQYTRLIKGIGLLTYKQRLDKLGLTTLLERRARGDLIETFRIVSGVANYGSNLFTMSHSGLKLINRGPSTSISQGFFSRRVVKYWNKLPNYVKMASSVNSFKHRLEVSKKDSTNKHGQYWELSDEIFNRIGDDCRTGYTEFMLDHPYIAKKKGVNIH